VEPGATKLTQWRSRGKQRKRKREEHGDRGEHEESEESGRSPPPRPRHSRNRTPFRAIGIVLIVAGAVVVLDSFARFALQGIGTPAPVFPTRHLVVNGFYRYVRNPMYVAVLALILGQALLFGNLHLVAYAAAPWFAAHLFILFYEEPALRRSFPTDYALYSANVPRWIPRLTPWRSPTQ
jgi:protein-S-isoprenylcysteine O-methyltransferase Ste14